MSLFGFKRIRRYLNHKTEFTPSCTRASCNKKKRFYEKKTLSLTISVSICPKMMLSICVNIDFDVAWLIGLLLNIKTDDIRTRSGINRIDDDNLLKTTY